MDQLEGYDPLTDWVLLASETHMLKTEEWIKLYIKQKPRWMPSSLWKWLIRELIVQVRGGVQATVK